MECRLKWCKDNIFVGDVVASSVDEDLIRGSAKERQMKLRQILLVGANMYSIIGEIKELPLRIIKQYKEETRD